LSHQDRLSKSKIELQGRRLGKRLPFFKIRFTLFWGKKGRGWGRNLFPKGKELRKVLFQKEGNWKPLSLFLNFFWKEGSRKEGLGSLGPGRNGEPRLTEGT